MLRLRRDVRGEERGDLRCDPHIAETGAEVCTAADSSCLLQIGGGLSRSDSGVRTAHLAEILAAEA